MAQYSEKRVCPVCGGSARRPAGKGRCSGEIAEDGASARCTSASHGGSLTSSQGTFVHALRGTCPCGRGPHNVRQLDRSAPRGPRGPRAPSAARDLDPDTIRAIPHDHRTEHDLLGALLGNPARLPDIAARLPRSAFDLPRHAIVWDAMLAIGPARLTVMALVELLRERDQLEAVGGFVWVAEFTDVPTNAFLDAHAKQLLELATARGLIRELEAIAARGYDRTESPTELIEFAQGRMLELAAVATPGRTPRRTLRDAFNQADIEHMLTTAPPPLQWIVETMIPERSTGMLAAAGGTGKGHWTIQLALSVAAGLRFGPFAVEHPRGILCLSREDDLAELHRRLCSGIDALFPSGIDAGYSRDIAARLRLIDTTGVRSAVFGPELLEHLIRCARSTPDCGVIVLDPLSKLLPPDSGISLNSQEGAGAIHAFADEIRVETGCTVLLVHHVNKASKRAGSELDSTAATGSLQLVDCARWMINMKALDPADCAAYGLQGPSRYLELRGPKYNYGPGFAGPVLFRRSAGGALVHVDPPNLALVDRHRCLDALADLGGPATREAWIAACAALEPKISKHRADHARTALVEGGLVVVVLAPSTTGGARKRLFAPAGQATGEREI